ncbi:MAG TPA: hypothetical protein VFQ17_07410 [Nocardioides sp.]|nr:hypothetical protein [Nocardioides sp.]
MSALDSAPSRVGLGALILSIVLAVLSLSATPAGAATPVSTGTAPASCGPGVNQRIDGRCTDTLPQEFSEGGCGFLQRCIYFNRTEQTYLITGSKWIVQAALCAAGIGLGCVAAGLVVEIAAQWLLSRGGICPTSKPRLRVQWFPVPQVEGCVA